MYHTLQVPVPAQLRASQGFHQNSVAACQNMTSKAKSRPWACTHPSGHSSPRRRCKAAGARNACSPPNSSTEAYTLTQTSANVPAECGEPASDQPVSLALQWNSLGVPAIHAAVLVHWKHRAAICQGHEQVKDIFNGIGRSHLSRGFDLQCFKDLR